MASLEESPEPWEWNLQGKKSFNAGGTRDVLILVSSESGGADIVARKKGELTQQDKDRLTSEGIPQHCWEDDAMIMKERYSKDKNFKSIIIENTLHMKKQHVVDKISTLFNNTTQHGVLLHYIGPGRRGTGDWCFSDGFISFTDIADLYMQHFTGRVLTINSNCSYSGQWVESCKEFLDSQGVQPCGHSARKTGIKIKVWCSCQLDQVGSTLVFSAKGHANDKNTGTSYVNYGLSIAPDQTTCGWDFTLITCDKSPEEECALVPNFTFQTKKKASRVLLVKGEDRGRPAWHYVLLVDDPETIRIFKERTQGENAGTQTTSINDYGLALKSGWGQDPPQHVKDWLKRVIDGLEHHPQY